MRLKNKLLDKSNQLKRSKTPIKKSERSFISNINLIEKHDFLLMNKIILSIYLERRNTGIETQERSESFIAGNNSSQTNFLTCFDSFLQKGSFLQSAPNESFLKSFARCQEGIPIQNS